MVIQFIVHQVDRRSLYDIAYTLFRHQIHQEGTGSKVGLSTLDRTKMW
jgi:hypothetical protein